VDAPAQSKARTIQKAREEEENKMYEFGRDVNQSLDLAHMRHAELLAEAERVRLLRRMQVNGPLAWTKRGRVSPLLAWVRGFYSNVAAVRVSWKGFRSAGLLE
jgi:hypothetical protein